MPRRQVQVQAIPGLWPPTWPMGLTFLRLLLLPVFLWVMLENSHHADHPRPWLAIIVFAIMAITDKLDGWLARRLNQTSKLGAVLDPVADKLLVACSVILLNFEWIAPPGFRIPGWVVLAVYGKDLVIGIGTIVLLALAGTVTIHARPLGKVSTVVQLSMVIAVLLGPPRDAWWFSSWSVFVMGLWWAVAALALAACLDYVLQGVKQFRSRKSASTEKQQVGV